MDQTTRDGGGSMLGVNVFYKLGGPLQWISRKSWGMPVSFPSADLGKVGAWIGREGGGRGSQFIQESGSSYMWNSPTLVLLLLISQRLTSLTSDLATLSTQKMRTSSNMSPVLDVGAEPARLLSPRRLQSSISCTPTFTFQTNTYQQPMK